MRPMCIPFHEVNLSVTIEFFESREGLEPSNVSIYAVLQTGPLPFGHLDIFLFNKMSKNNVVGEEGLEPPVSKESDVTDRAATSYRLLSHFKEVDLRGTDCQNPI